MTLEESVKEFTLSQYAYFDQWMLDEPLIISEDFNNDLLLLQKLMYKLIQEFVTNYQDYKQLMPIAPEVEDIIQLFNTKPYKIGTYRTDFVFDDKKQVKLIEITCRFALNGMFLSSILNKKADNYLKTNFPSLKSIDCYSGIFKRFTSYLEGVDSIIILKGSDVRNESKIYEAIFERTGLTVEAVHFSEIDQHLDQMKSAWVISELSFDEILSLDKKTLEALVPLNISNDFRTVFLIHDKRFFDVMGNTQLQQKVFSEEEAEFFNRYYIPTYSYDVNSEQWKSAQSNKNRWIIKHRALGKSQEIYAGIVTSEEEWEALFVSDNIGEMVLQEWIDQETSENTLKGEPINDFITGTLLYFDDNYYGFGDFRTSSFPVTNKVDHRKLAGLILKDFDNLPESLKQKAIY